MSEPAQPNLSSISTPSASVLPALTDSPQHTPTAVPPLADFNTPPTTNRRNIVGFALIASVVIFILVVTLPRRNKAANETRQPK